MSYEILRTDLVRLRRQMGIKIVFRTISGNQVLKILGNSLLCLRRFGPNSIYKLRRNHQVKRHHFLLWHDFHPCLCAHDVHNVCNMTFLQKFSKARLENGVFHGFLSPLRYTPFLTTRPPPQTQSMDLWEKYRYDLCCRGGSGPRGG